MTQSVGRRTADRTAEDRAGARYWSIDDIRLECGVSLSSAWRLVRREGFPAPVVLGPKLIRWRRTDVLRFIDDLAAPGRYASKSDPGAPGAPAAHTVRAVRRG